MSRYKLSKRAVALHYDENSQAPVIVASGMGNLAEKIVQVASDNGVPVYEDNSLATVLSQLELGREIPPELYEAIVEIYLYFLQFDPNDPGKFARQRMEFMTAKAPDTPTELTNEQVAQTQTEEQTQVEVGGEQAHGI